jgi:hypothetical protein
VVTCPRRRRYLTLTALAALLCTAAALYAQAPRRGIGRWADTVDRVARPDDISGDFHFCRIAFANDLRGDGGNWQVDYPRADINLSIRLGELTRTAVNMDAYGDPRPLAMRLTDDVMFQCPFIMMTEVGSAAIRPSEAERLCEYLLKGGFLWVDDFWGNYAWDWWAAQIDQVLPTAEYPIVDLPLDHPLFSSQFVISEVPQIANIGHWQRTGGGTSERYEDSAVAHARAILDDQGHVMVLMTHNTDLGDSFEREADDPQDFYEMSVKGYAFGVNALLYALTH